jgi:hypothetical protein
VNKRPALSEFHRDQSQELPFEVLYISSKNQFISFNNKIRDNVLAKQDELEWDCHDSLWSESSADNSFLYL